MVEAHAPCSSSSAPSRAHDQAAPRGWAAQMTGDDQAELLGHLTDMALVSLAGNLRSFPIVDHAGRSVLGTMPLSIYYIIIIITKSSSSFSIIIVIIIITIIAVIVIVVIVIIVSSIMRMCVCAIIHNHLKRMALRPWSRLQP